jgi:hypothetical protein
MSVKYVRHGFEGMGRKLGAQPDASRACSKMSEMFAILAGHSVDTSESEYALDSEAFKGLGSDDRTSWEKAGKLFNRSLGYDGDSSVEELLAGYAVQALPFVEQPTLPPARPMQQATLAAMEGLLAQESNGLCIALIQPPGVYPYRTSRFSWFHSGTGKTWYYLSLCAKFRCVVIVVVPLKPLLEEAVANARSRHFKAFEMKSLLTLSPDELWDRTSGSCLIFVSMDTLSSCHSVLTLGRPCIVVIDEAHMIKLDIHYRPNFRSGWELGARNVSQFPWILLTATLRPSMENDVIYNLGLEDASNLHVLRSTVDRGVEYPVFVEWYSQKSDALAWLRRTEPNIIFVMTRGQAEQLAKDLGIIFIHSECEDADRRKKIDAVSRGQVRCVATSSIGVGVNMDPKHVVIFDFTCVRFFVRFVLLPSFRCRYTIELLMQLLGRIRHVSGRATVLTNRQALERRQLAADDGVAEVFLFHHAGAHSFQAHSTSLAHTRAGVWCYTECRLSPKPVCVARRRRLASQCCLSFDV